MQKQSDAASNAEQAFLEYHFYSSGLRTEVFSLSGLRPDWAPPWDWVGFRDEFALNPEDRVIEVVKFATERGPVTWFGVYQAASDKVLGDRKYHAGLGVWLLGGYPRMPWLVSDGLQKLMGRADNLDVLREKAQTFLGAYLEKVVDEYETLPRPFGGLSSAQNQVVKTLLLQIDARDANAQEQFDDLIYRLFYYLQADVSDHSRALILLSAEARPREIAAADNQPGKLVFDLMAQLPNAMRAQSQAIAALEQDLATGKASLDKLDGNIDRLESELMSARRRANDAEEQLRNLQASLKDDDELKRFSLLQTSIADVNNNVGQLQARIGTLKQEILNDLRRMPHSTPEVSLSDNEFRQRQIGQQSPPQSKVLKGSRGGGIWLWVIFAAMILFLLGFLIRWLVW